MGGQLWLGGEAASGDLQLLQKHNITVVGPAARSPMIAESTHLTVYPYQDGTGITAGPADLENVKLRVRVCSDSVSKKVKTRTFLTMGIVSLTSLESRV